MISDNIPVVFSYYVDGDNLTLYFTQENAINHLTGRRYSTSTNSHYMTIIGYAKYMDPTDSRYKYVLKIVSWGNIYFVDFEEYVKHINIYTNLLEVSR